MDIYDKQIDRVLSKFIDNLKIEKIKAPNFKTIANYNAFRSISTTLYIKGNPDYDYWKNSGLYKYPYHPDINIGIIKSIFGNTLYKVISRRMESSKGMKYNERRIKIIKRLPKEK
nr:hypothetical protein [uncultured Romboutsia sp.]